MFVSKCEIRLGDSAELLKLLPSESVDLVVTSPPYDNLRDYNGYVFDFENIAKELFRVIKTGGVVVWIVNDACIDGSESLTSFKQALFFKEIGFNVHDTMIWLKDTFALPDRSRYGQVFEYMFVFSKGKPKSVNKICDRRNKWYGSQIHGTTRLSDGTTIRKSNDKASSVNEFGERFNVWNIPSEKNNTSGHPAVFPLQLAIDHIKSWSNEGDTVLDPFCGSGTTAIASYKLGRQFIGFEISKEYWKIANDRLSMETSQIDIREIIEHSKGE